MGQQRNILQASVWTYQVADNDFAFSSGRQGRGCSCGSCGGSLGLTLGGLGGGSVFGNSSGGNSGLAAAASATGVVATRASNLLEALVKLGRRHVDVCLAKWIGERNGCLRLRV